MASQDPYILQPMTLLDAVNNVLWGIGSKAVLSLDTQGLTTDAAAALRLVHSVSTQVQTPGWNWNTDYDLVIDPAPQDAQQVADRGSCSLPQTTLSADTSGKDTWRNLVMRGKKLYDPVKHTFNIGISITVTIVTMLDFNDLPQAARNYIAARSARLFAASKLNNPTTTSFLSNEEIIAMVALEEEEDKSDDRTLYQKNGRMARMHLRRRFT